MKLYNLYESIILENTKQTVIDAINGKYAVNIWYRDKVTNELKKRYVFIYGLGVNKAGNEVIRAFQAFGGTNSKNSKWKTFLLNNITRIEPTNMKFYKPINKVSGGEDVPAYVGPSDKSMVGDKLTNYVTF
jgi:hypothetical protein